MPHNKRLRGHSGRQSASHNVYHVVNSQPVPSPAAPSNITSKNPVAERVLAYRAKIKKSYRVIAEQIAETIGAQIDRDTVERAAKGANLSELSILKIEEFLQKVGM